MASGSKAVTVECRGRNPCCVELRTNAAERKGRIRRSRTFIEGQRREIGLYEVFWSAGLPGLSTSMTFADFQIAGMSADATERLNRWVM